MKNDRSENVPANIPLTMSTLEIAGSCEAPRGSKYLYIADFGYGRKVGIAKSPSSRLKTISLQTGKKIIAAFVAGPFWHPHDVESAVLSELSNGGGRCEWIEASIDAVKEAVERIEPPSRCSRPVHMKSTTEIADGLMSAIEAKFSGAASPVQAIVLAEIDGEPRARDLDLADRLGFERPRKIRELIERHAEEIDTLGTRPAVGRILKGARGSTEATEYWLNEEQALLVAILSKAPKAPAVRAMLIKVFVAWRRGHFAAPTDSHAGLLDEKSRSAIGGIVKGVVHKEIANLLPAMVEAAIAADTRRAVLDYASVRQLLEEAGAVSKGRKSLNRRVGYRLGIIARSEGGARRCPHTGVWLYPRIMADRFMREEGLALVKEHNDRASGQGVLRLVKKCCEDRAESSRGA